MKRLIAIISLLICSFSVFSQTISKVDANQVGQTIVITFTMDKPTDVTISYSTKGAKGAYAAIPEKYLVKTVQTGTQYTYTWNVLEQYEEFVYSDVVFKVEKKNTIEAVDLGLSVQWATCNVGATKPEEYGKYYTYDDALKIDKKGMRVPSKSEMQELLDKCTWTWTTIQGVKGYKVIGPNGNSIFLPAAGSRNGSGVGYVGSYGYYWSSSAGSNYYYAYCLYFLSDDADVSNNDRYYGRSVRLVRGW